MSERKEAVEKMTKSAAGHVYWHDGIPALVATHPAPLRKVDVVVIGAGYTGLHAALTALRAGRSVQIVEMHELGWGCSTRNGGRCGF